MRRSIADEGAPGIRSEKIPYELWLQIIEYSSLDHADISRLTLVSKLLRYVAQPILFSTFRITLLRAQYLGIAPVPCQRIAYRDRLSERLEFASLPRVVQFVKAFVIFMGGERADLSMTDIVKEEDLLGMLFQNVGRFTNLRSFSAQQTSLTGSHFDSLAELKYLSEIHLERCRCTGDLGLARFQLKVLSLHGRMTGTHGWWIPLLKSPSIRQLSYDAVRGPPEDPELFFPALSTGPIMHSLRTLRLPPFSVNFPCFELALSRCPLLENLYLAAPDVPTSHRFAPPEANWPLLPPRCLSNLRAIKAPPGFIEFSVLKSGSGKRLKHITVAEALRYNDGILAAVKDACPGLEELVLHLETFPLDTSPRPFLLQAIFTAFPTLRGLRITFDMIRFSYGQLRGLLKTVTYPATLRSLHIAASNPPREGGLAPSPDRKRKRRTSSTKRLPDLVEHIRTHSPSIAEIEIVLDKSISWRDMYIRCNKWYEWDVHGGRAPLV